MLAPRLVKPLASVVGFPAARFGGSPGRLARENAVRNPGRTASTAAALMIGLALVTVVATLGAGLRGSTETAVKQAGQGRLRRHRQGRRRLVPGRLRRGLRRPRASRSSRACAQDTGKVAGDESPVTGIDPKTIDHFYTLQWSRARSPGSTTAARS